MTVAATIHTDKRPSADEAIALYTACGWGQPDDYDPVIWQATLDATTFLITAYDGEKLVGILRALSDRHHETYLNDIVVHPKYQDRKIGRTLMAKLVELADNTGIYINAFEQNRDFLESCGFQIKKHMFVATRAPFGKTRA